jgi:hypothetical protein
MNLMSAQQLQQFAQEYLAHKRLQSQQLHPILHPQLRLAIHH